MKVEEIFECRNCNEEVPAWMSVTRDKYAMYCSNSCADEHKIKQEDKLLSAQRRFYES